MRSVRVLVTVAVAGWLMCMADHYCMDGHLAHEPDALWKMPQFDVAWLACVAAAGVFGVRSRLPLRWLLVGAAALVVYASCVRMRRPGDDLAQFDTFGVLLCLLGAWWPDRSLSRARAERA